MTRVMLAFAALIIGLAAALVGAPRTVDVDALAKQIAREEDHVTADELAQWTRDRRPGLRVIDVGQASTLESITKTHFAKDETIVLVSEGGAHAAQAWVLLRAMGHRNVYFLRGGLAATSSDMELARYFGRGGC